MTLELNKVTEQIDEMGYILAKRAERQFKALPAARELLHLYANDQEYLHQVAESDSGQTLRCAHPADEVLDQTFPAPPAPERLTLLATDGSQIFPDRHGPAFYYAINIGSIIFRQGSGQAPKVATAPRLFYTDDRMYPDGNPVSSDLVSAERDLAEMRTLADLVLEEPADGSLRVGLADGPLLIWLQRKNLPQGLSEQILADYLACLDRLRAERAPVAGFVSRPYSAEVVSLLYLAHLEPEERQDLHSLADTSFRGLTDRALFGYLRPGERSALFVRGTAENQSFRAKGHAVCFFYLNTGTDMARVEVPEWVAHQPQRLDLVHAITHDQCRFNNGYPYVLTRADELAVILGEEREVLRGMIAQAMARHGLQLPEPSRKAQQKQVARWRKRR